MRFEAPLEIGEEAAGDVAVDDAVVERKTRVHHAPDRDRVVVAHDQVFTTVSIVTMPACPALMIGADAHEPFAPLLLTVNVPPARSSTPSFAPARFVDQLAGRDRESLDRKLVGVA